MPISNITSIFTVYSLNNHKKMSRPTVTIEELSSDILKLYSMKISEVKEQLSYDDAMFLFTGNGKHI